MPSPEQFDPTNEKYKRVEDLPSEQQSSFVNVGDGFTRREQAELHKKLVDDGEIYKTDPNEELQDMAWIIERIRQVVGDGSVWVTAIKERGIAAAQELGKAIQLPAFSRRLGVDAEMESLIVTLLSSQTLQERYGSVTAAIAEEWASHQDALQGGDRLWSDKWAHEACHTIEGYPSKPSLLGQPETHQAAEKIASTGIHFAIEDQDLSKELLRGGNVQRMIGPMIKWNFDNLVLDPASVDQPFPVHPDATYAEAFLKKFGGENGSFVASSTPREFITRVINDQFSLRITSPRTFLELARLCEATLDQAKLQEYLKTQYRLQDQNTITPEILIDKLNQAEAAQEVVDGLFVDVDGTLIIDGQLNQKLVDRLQSRATNGEKIVIFTGGNPEEATTRLRELGVPENLLPVAPKTGYQGLVLAELIDDTAPEYQGFKAKKRSDIFGRGF